MLKYTSVLVPGSFGPTFENRLPKPRFSARYARGPSECPIYIGSAGFSGLAGEVRVTTAGGVGTVIRVDVDGDVASDMKIVAAGVIAMNEADFIL